MPKTKKEPHLEELLSECERYCGKGTYTLQRVSNNSAILLLPEPFGTKPEPYVESLNQNVVHLFPRLILWAKKKAESYHNAVLVLCTTTTMVSVKGKKAKVVLAYSIEDTVTGEQKEASGEIHIFADGMHVEKEEVDRK